MAFALTWKIEFGDASGLTDITSYVMQMNMDLSAPIGMSGRSTASITINNNAGQFTPNSGTYGSTDWFSKAIIITATSGANTGIAYAGMIVDFQISMVSSKESTVTIECLDFYSLGGKSYSLGTTAGGGAILEVAIEDSYNSGFTTGFPGINKPKLNASVGYGSAANVTTATSILTYIDPFRVNAEYIGDWLNSQLLPAGPATLIPTDYTYAGAFNDWYFNATLIDQSLNRTTKTLYELVDGSSAITSGQIPFAQIDTGFTQDELTNEALIGFTSATTVRTQNTTSQNLYGPRTRTYSNIANSTLFETETAIDTRIGNFWVNRYGTIRYIPQRVATSYAVLRSNAVDDGVAMLLFMKLLWPDTALWNRIAIKYEPTGATSTQIEQLVAVQRIITVDPSDTVVRLVLVSGVDNQSFELDSSTYGILGGDSITYDQPEIDYDENGWIYNDSNVEQGNRLG